MKESTVKVLAKLVAYILVTLWIVKRWYYYVSKGHLWFEVKLFFHREKPSGNLDTVRTLYDPNYSEPPTIGFGGEAYRVKKSVSKILPEPEQYLNQADKITEKTRTGRLKEIGIVKERAG